MIFNHVAPALSELDTEMISHVQPGGNWKDIPESVPSNRLAGIRKSFAEGKGSRSSYYGRLLADDPAYTISTFFPRPGNGSNIHYRDDRTLTYREAARLQSFPDSFVFTGSKSAVATQIGNAVPPLLGMQIADALKLGPGMFIDLFAGAGGLGLGFEWAGWLPVVASDIDKNALETHSRNLDCPVVLGDITDEEIKRRIVEYASEARKVHPEMPLIVLGGPPCQGFSTANARRSADDVRNWLFREYSDLISQIQPDAFVFENVPGLLNMQGGRFFRMIQTSLKETVEAIRVEKVNSASFGVPQRRNRVIIFGGKRTDMENVSLEAITDAPEVVARSDRGAIKQGINSRSSIMVEEALGDLPSVAAGVDGSLMEYPCQPQTRYQQLMRGQVSPREFLQFPRDLRNEFYERFEHSSGDSLEGEDILVLF
ncbi:DNA (cytosine-5-)-methyltransferase [Corynebacterium mucifaciens]|uniref:DNA (cytosine-5-)-methyltransferase n=1 Tax=Corynebacterium mucifaciens TaxID=57171 RepID=A0A7X6REA4_9CORY|nr:DNA (cytosine-5-)-methyltransferase [Corynebacterium mucifaciens]NKY68039.1 DNA cytosine methyltransferase [Corynebacterium mucifaciens]